MYWTHSFPFWWLIPVLMILFCFVMCFAMRRRGMAGCCMSWHGSRDDGWQGRPTGRDDERHANTDSSTPAADKALKESLNAAALEGLERRIRRLEEATTEKKLTQGPPCTKS